MIGARSFVALLAVLLGVGCASNPPPALPASALDQTRGPESAAPAGSGAAGKPTATSVYVAPEIREACGITTPEAYFAFGSADVTERDHRILEKLAQCFIKGAMFGHSMALVGHADPRGDEEYNLLLGGRRADAVRQALIERGLDTRRVQASSRGEYEAKGTDEEGWRQDRRVDVLLAR
jgi:peptidoglycan-associated lipoprotein